MIADHKLATVKTRQDRGATAHFIKDPKAPMPKLYPDLITDQAVTDVTEYLYSELAP